MTAAWAGSLGEDAYGGLPGEPNSQRQGAQMVARSPAGVNDAAPRGPSAPGRPPRNLALARPASAKCRRDKPRPAIRQHHLADRTVAGYRQADLGLGPPARVGPVAGHP